MDSAFLTPRKAMVRILYQLVFLVLLMIPESWGQCILDRSNYEMVFHEEFNLSSIAEIDTGIWRFEPDLFGHGYGDDVYREEIIPCHYSYGEYYDKSQASIVDHDFLRLTCQKLYGPERIPYTGATNCNGYRYPKFKSGMIQLQRNLHSAPFEGTKNWGGFKYGLIEARIKIPPGPTFPAFWTDGTVNAQILEGKESPREFMTEAFGSWKCTPLSSSLRHFKIGDDLAQDFHVYSMNWTPNEITFFLDDRELGTLRGPEVQNAMRCFDEANTIVIDLAMRGYVWSPELPEEFHMDVDWIRVYKPVNNDWSLPFKTSVEWINHNAFDSVVAPPPCSSEPNSIAIISTAGNHFFYRGRDDNPYEAVQLNEDLWQPKPTIKFSNRKNKIQGDLLFDPHSGKLLYRGRDGKIQYVVWSSERGWYHGYLGDGAVAYDVLNAPGSMALSGDGSLFFLNPRHDVCKWKFVGGADSVETLFSAYPEKSSGDLIVLGATKLCYRGYLDDLIHIIYDSAGRWRHTVISDSAQPAMNAQPGSICKGRNGANEIFYVDVANRIHRVLALNSNHSWQYDSIAYDYGRLGDPVADLVRGNLSYEQLSNKICYFGQDGRLQYFQHNDSTSRWSHGYIDSYWNTYAFQSYSGPQNPRVCPSLVCHPLTGRIFYVGDCEYSDHDGFHAEHDNVRYFDYGSCEADGWKKNFVYRNLY